MEPRTSRRKSKRARISQSSSGETDKQHTPKKLKARNVVLMNESPEDSDENPTEQTATTSNQQQAPVDSVLVLSGLDGS